MTEPTRWVVVDDRDSRIQYSNGWQSTGGDRFNNQGNFGATYRNSLHGTGTVSAKLSFSFTGNAARIKGTTDLQVDSSGVPNPDWECTLDGKVVKRENPFPYTENNWTFCSFRDLPGGDHTIGLTVKTSERNFWVDYIEYRPTITVEDEVLSASRDDADLSFSGGWAALGDVGHNTLVKGSSATFKFIGTGVSLYAMYPSELPHANGQATYSIDGGPSTTFTIPGGGDQSIYNRKIFEVNGLSKESHTIVITYTSDGGSTPLVISQFYIEGGTNLRAPAAGSGSSAGTSSDGSSTSTTTSTNPNSTTVSVANPTSSTATKGESSSSSTAGLLPGDSATPSDVAGAPGGDRSGGSTSGTSDFAGGNDGSSPSSKVPIGAIVGAVLGAIAALLLLFLLVWYRRRKRIRLREDAVDQPPFRMTRDEHPGALPEMSTPIYDNFAAPPSIPGAIYPVHNGGFASHPPTPAQPPVQHPAARSKRGPQFNSPYISNQSPYDDDPPAVSTAHLVPAHHGPQGSFDQSESAYSGIYTNSTYSSTPSRAVYHEDSGVRIPVTQAEPVVEYPPMYSAR